MPDDILKEEPLQFGDGRRLLGILTRPSLPPRNSQELPVFIFLDAGLLHRVGPHRLYVRLARDLSKMGFASLRVDLAGRGDSPPRAGLTDQQSVAADFAEILAGLESRLDRLPVVLAGLCSGADNAIRLTPEEPRVVGMILLDPVCFPDRGFPFRVAAARYTNPARYIAWLKRHFNARRCQKKQENDRLVDPLTLRDFPTREQLQAAFHSLRDRGGRVLSIFTHFALEYYNKTGQLRRVLGINGYSQFCTELFWPHVDHTYRLELHRQRVIEEIKTWAGNYQVRMHENPFALRSRCRSFFIASHSKADGSLTDVDR